MLKAIAEELYKRAQTDEVGGWSTNLVDPMRKLSTKIQTHLAGGGSDLDQKLLTHVAKEFNQYLHELDSYGWSTQNKDFFIETCRKFG